MNDMTEPDKDLASGTYKLSEDALTTIIADAISQIDGIAESAGAIGTIPRFIGKHRRVRNLKIDINDRTIALNLEIGILYGFVIPEVAGAAQKAIKQAVESMTGLTVRAVDITISNIESTAK